MNRLPGHALQFEGSPRFDATGWAAYRLVDGGHAKCECGALSAPGISQNAAKRWHREHKADIRALLEAS